MKTKFISGRRPCAGYALLMVLGITGVTLIVLTATMNRTATVAKLNDRNNQYVANLNAAEAATEKVFAKMAYDFQSQGYSLVTANLGAYRDSVPLPSDSVPQNPYWGNFRFSNGNGLANKTWVSFLSSYSGALPSQYPGLFTSNAPIYRIVSNVSSTTGYTQMTNAVQEDVMLALVPISTYAIFYNSLLEFSTCATMTVNGRVHANSNIYVGAGGSATLTFNGAVTSTGDVSATTNNGAVWGTPDTYDSSNWRTTFALDPAFTEHTPSVTLTINMTNTHSMIDQPPSGELPGSTQGQQRMYNKAQVVLLISNTNVTAKIQISPSIVQVPGEDTLAITFSTTNNSYAAVTNLFPFLVLTNQFLDQREDKTITATQIDIKKYGQWLASNTNVTAKFGSGNYPAILYVADNRTPTSTKLPAVRLVNGTNLPSNGGVGFTVATPNPLYVKGDYNCTNFLASTNTSATVPAALMSDALTILSANWNDTTSFSISTSGPDAADNTTVNAALLTGIVASTSSATSGFSGGVHNLPRLLENWSNDDLWLNTSIINLFNSKNATNKFVTPSNNSGSYYTAPTRHFSFDVNFMNPARQPPGMPCALVPIRYNWTIPPPGTVTYNAVP